MTWPGYHDPFIEPMKDALRMYFDLHSTPPPNDPVLTCLAHVGLAMLHHDRKPFNHRNFRGVASWEVPAFIDPGFAAGSEGKAAVLSCTPQIVVNELLAAPAVPAPPVERESIKPPPELSRLLAAIAADEPD